MTTDSPPMTQQDVAAADLQIVSQMVSGYAGNTQHEAWLRILDALQQRSGDERERVARGLLEGLREQNPDLVEESRETVWLSGGCTPQSRGTIINIYDLADAVLGGQS